MSSFSSPYYPVYHNLPLYAFVPEYFILFISPFAWLLVVLAERQLE